MSNDKAFDINITSLSIIAKIPCKQEGSKSVLKRKKNNFFYTLTKMLWIETSMYLTQHSAVYLVDI